MIEEIEALQEKIAELEHTQAKTKRLEEDQRWKNGNRWTNCRMI